jgi:O-antigen ligase
MLALRARPHKLVQGITVVVFLIGLMIGSAILLAKGTRTAMAMGMVTVTVPLCLFAAINRPLLFPFGLYVALIPFDHLVVIPHWGTLTKLVAILAGFALLFWIIRKKEIFRPRAPMLLWGLLVVWAGATFGWALIIDQYGLSIFATLVQLYLLYVVISLVPATERDTDGVLLCVVLGGLAAALLGLYLFTHGVGVHGGREWVGLDAEAQSNAAASQQDTNPNSFAASLLLPMSIIMMMYLRVRKVLLKLLWAIGFFLMLGALVVSGSRGAMLATVCMVLFFLWRSRFRSQLVPIACCAGIASLFVPSIWVRFSTALSTGGAGRLSIWSVGVNAFKQHWLLGAGEGSFQDAYDRAYLSVFQQFNAHWHRAPHNLVLGAAVELGLVGLILLLLAWQAHYRIMNTVSKRNAKYHDTAVALQAALVGMFVASMFLDSLYEKYTWLIFMTIMLVAGSAERSTAEVSLSSCPIAVGLPQSSPTTVPEPMGWRR